MRTITSIPVFKIHIIPYCSSTCLCILILALITILIPFFLVFTDGFFKNSAQTYQQFSIKPTYQYCISATSSIASMTTTNLLSDNTFNSLLYLDTIKLSQQDNDADGLNDKFIMQITLKQSPTTNGKVNSIMVLLFFNAYGTYTTTTAMTLYNFYGSSISSVVSSGSLQLVQNNLVSTTTANTNYSSNPFVQNYYDLDATLQSYYQQDTYFKKNTNQLITNGDSQQTTVKIVLDLKNTQKVIVSPGVFQQIQWSWCYYIPLVIVLGYFSICMIDVLLKYGILQSRVSRF